MAALQQPEHRLTFADPALPLNDHADALDIHHAAMDLGPRGEQLFQCQCGLADELHRHQFGLEHRHAAVVSGGEELRFRTDTATQHHARDLVPEELVVALFPEVWLDGPQVGGFDRPEHLHPLVGEVAAESGQGQARAIDGGLLNEPTEGVAPGQ